MSLPTIVLLSLFLALVALTLQCAMLARRLRESRAALSERIAAAEAVARAQGAS